MGLRTLVLKAWRPVIFWYKINPGGDGGLNKATVSENIKVQGSSNSQDVVCNWLKAVGKGRIDSKINSRLMTCAGLKSSRRKYKGEMEAHGSQDRQHCSQN